MIFIIFYSKCEMDGITPESGGFVFRTLETKGTRIFLMIGVKKLVLFEPEASSQDLADHQKYSPGFRVLKIKPLDGNILLFLQYS
jgi:hypothetical protein